MNIGYMLLFGTLSSFFVAIGMALNELNFGKPTFLFKSGNETIEVKAWTLQKALTKYSDKRNLHYLKSYKKVWGNKMTNFEIESVKKGYEANKDGWSDF
jgi:hypothetical protein